MTGWENSITFTRDQFEEMYGPCPEWLWEMFVENQKQYIKEMSNEVKYFKG